MPIICNFLVFDSQNLLNLNEQRHFIYLDTKKNKNLDLHFSFPPKNRTNAWETYSMQGTMQPCSDTSAFTISGKLVPFRPDYFRHYWTFLSDCKISNRSALLQNWRVSYSKSAPWAFERGQNITYPARAISVTFQTKLMKVWRILIIFQCGANQAFKLERCTRKVCF